MPTQPALLDSAPPAPEHLEADEIAAWRELGTAAIAAGSLAASDLLLLESCAMLLASLRRIRREPTVKASMVTSAARELHSALRQLGLTPASRGTVKPLEPQRHERPDEDPLGDG